VGTGTGILLAVTIVYGYYEEFAMERKQMMSQFGM
jgi:preprotein translocase subunit SecY